MVARNEERPTNSANDPILQIDEISLSFGGFHAVDGVSMDVGRGSITGLIGPNGAGKTTLLNLTAGALLPTKGLVRFDGQDITRLTADQRFHRGLVRTFQIPHEFHRLTVLENLMMVPAGQSGERLLANWVNWRAVKAVEREVEARARETLSFLEMTDVGEERAGNLSGGQKKLLELGRTMMTDAKLVLLDEPAAGVNRTLLRKLEEKIAYLNTQRGYTFLLVEHDMDVIEKLCHPVICMAEGKILAQGDFESVKSEPAVKEAYLGEPAGSIEDEAMVAVS